ncbi:hypothetical protein U14_04778 [Candidatus Moduliflexus flocculans]|uniref:Uncharacterized protein n=1 Tax=Candidatus Moduliflexus flocculans TaxID=1499966 RepID=A0A0S6W546_9BACT|nr:hypothetical protein U14_04778 [Candidatus Moduliflexus flocculans]
MELIPKTLIFGFKCFNPSLELLDPPQQVFDHPKGLRQIFNGRDDNDRCFHRTFLYSCFLTKIK